MAIGSNWNHGQYRKGGGESLMRVTARFRLDEENKRDLTAFQVPIGTRKFLFSLFQLATSRVDNHPQMIPHLLRSDGYTHQCRWQHRVDDRRNLARLGSSLSIHHTWKMTHLRAVVYAPYVWRMKWTNVSCTASGTSMKSTQGITNEKGAAYRGPQTQIAPQHARKSTRGLTRTVPTSIGKP